MIEGMIQAVITFFCCWLFTFVASIACLAMGRKTCPIVGVTLMVGLISLVIGGAIIGMPTIFGAGVGTFGFLSWRYRDRI